MNLIAANPVIQVLICLSCIKCKDSSIHSFLNPDFTKNRAQAEQLFSSNVEK
jgi:hypothetical protein